MVWTQASPEGLALTRAKPIWIAMTVKHAASVILQGKGCPLVVVLCIANCKLRKHKNNIKKSTTTSSPPSPSSSRNPKPLARFGSPTCEGTGSNPGTLIHTLDNRKTTCICSYPFTLPSHMQRFYIDDHQTQKNQHILNTNVQICQYSFLAGYLHSVCR